MAETAIFPGGFGGIWGEKVKEIRLCCKSRRTGFVANGGWFTLSLRFKFLLWFGKSLNNGINGLEKELIGIIKELMASVVCKSCKDWADLTVVSGLQGLECVFLSFLKLL